MRNVKHKPSKPVAVLGIVFGIGMLVFGITAFRDEEGFGLAFLVSWCAGVVAITTLNTCAAFSKKGSLGWFVTQDADAGRDKPQGFL